MRSSLIARACHTARTGEHRGKGAGKPRVIVPPAQGEFPFTPSLRLARDRRSGLPYARVARRSKPGKVPIDSDTPDPGRQGAFLCRCDFDCRAETLIFSAIVSVLGVVCSSGIVTFDGASIPTLVDAHTAITPAGDDK